MKDERNWLLRDALPQLQQFAVSNELQLQVVDLRWGSSMDVVTDPDCQPIYLQQIELCRQHSAGPFFAVRNFATSTQRSARQREIPREWESHGNGNSHMAYYGNEMGMGIKQR